MLNSWYGVQPVWPALLPSPYLASMVASTSPLYRVGTVNASALPVASDSTGSS